MFLRYRLILCAALAIIAGTGCGSSGGTVDDAGEDAADNADASADASVDGGDDTPAVLFAIDDAGSLISFAPATPGTITAKAITGLEGGEKIVALDFRPSTGVLYGFGSTSRLYTINTETGAATMVGPQLTDPLSGLYFGLGFNPTADRIRILNIAQQNIRLNPDTGALAGTDTTLSYAAGDTHAGASPHFVECAYTNSFASAPTTTLYAIDPTFDVLTLATNPNGGTYATVGALGVDASDDVGFDIAYYGGADHAYAALRVAPATASSLYTVNLATGAVTLVGAIAGNPVHGLAYRE